MEKQTEKMSSKKSRSVSSKNMEARKKVFFVLVILVVVLALVVIAIPMFKKVATSNKLSEEKSFETYKLKETSITYDEETTIFETKIENISSETIPAGGFNILLLDKEGKELTSIGVYLKEMEPSEVIDTKAVIAEKVENVYDIKIVSDENIVPSEEEVQEVVEDSQNAEQTTENVEEESVEE